MLESNLKVKSVSRLNPCCNGIYLIIQSKQWQLAASYRLNPCCNGIYLIIFAAANLLAAGQSVLILVVMEYT